MNRGVLKRQYVVYVPFDIHPTWRANSAALQSTSIAGLPAKHVRVRHYVSASFPPIQPRFSMQDADITLAGWSRRTSKQHSVAEYVSINEIRCAACLPVERCQGRTGGGGEWRTIRFLRDAQTTHRNLALCISLPTPTGSYDVGRPYFEISTVEPI